MLPDAAVRGAKDELEGLKENIIIGHLVPAGTGVHRFHDVEFLVEGAPIEREISEVANARAEPKEEEISLADLVRGATTPPATGSGD